MHIPSIFEGSQIKEFGLWRATSALTRGFQREWPKVTVSFHLLLAELTTLCKLLKLLKYYTIFPLSSYKEWTWVFGHLHLALLLNNTITNTTILCYQYTVFASTQEQIKKSIRSVYICFPKGTTSLNGSLNPKFAS